MPDQPEERRPNWRTRRSPGSPFRKVSFAFKFNISRQYNRKLPVSVGAALHCTLGSKPRSVHINATEVNQLAMFKSSGKDIEFIGPVISAT